MPPPRVLAIFELMPSGRMPAPAPLPASAAPKYEAPREHKKRLGPPPLDAQNGSAEIAAAGHFSLDAQMRDAGGGTLSVSP
jgi:hypothetical protein